MASRQTPRLPCVAGPGTGADRSVSIVLCALLLCFLIGAASHARLDFDASYNLLSYQSLFEGRGFTYQYDGRSTPFDPVISTGPELYLPVLLVWEIQGAATYVAASYLLVAWYALFLVAFVCHILRDAPVTSIGVATLVVLYLSDRQLLAQHVFIDPKGEPLAALLVFYGLFLICRSPTRIAGFLVLGLAIDVKNNVVVGLLPALSAYFVLEYLTRLRRQRDRGHLAHETRKLLVGSVLLVLPVLTYTQLAPRVSLGPERFQALADAQEARSRYMVNKGFGHLIGLLEDPSPRGLAEYVDHLETKLAILRSFFGGSWLWTTVVLVALPLLLRFTRADHHFTFYVLVAVTSLLGWWLFAVSNPWYRYFAVVDLLLMLTLATLVPRALALGRPGVMVLLAVVVLAMSVPRFSWGSIRGRFDDADKRAQLAMADRMQGLEEEAVFTYGWFQAPQLMFLTGKRFQDYRDHEKLHEARLRYRNVYFVTTAENPPDQLAIDDLGLRLQEVAVFGRNGLFRFPPLAEDPGVRPSSGARR